MECSSEYEREPDDAGRLSPKARPSRPWDLAALAAGSSTWFLVAEDLPWPLCLLAGTGLGLVSVASWRWTAQRLKPGQRPRLPARTWIRLLLTGLVVALSAELFPEETILAAIGYFSGLAGGLRRLVRRVAVPAAVLLALSQGSALAETVAGPSHSPRPGPIVAPSQAPEARPAHASGGPTEGRSQTGHDETNKTELPTLGEWLVTLWPRSALARWFAQEWVERLFWTILSTALLALLAVWVARRATLVPGRLQSLVEMALESIVDLFEGTLPRSRAARFVPFVGSLFVYILTVNVAGLLPLTRPGTSYIAMTGGLAAVVFLVVQYTAFKELGPIGYLYHLAGEPKDFFSWLLVPLMLPLHLIEEVAKPFTLALRLFGNVLGEHSLLGVLTALGVLSLASFHLPIGIPFEFPILFLALLMGVIQALVFAMLATIYLALVIPEDHGKTQRRSKP